MKSVFAIILLLISILTHSQSPIPPVGMWREHLPYNNAIDVTAGDGRIWCATPYSLFTVAMADNFIERWSRVTGLNETGVSTITYDAANEKLFIAYANSNIDIIYRNDIYNVPDIKQDNIIGDKSIYNIYALGKNYYLSTGLGIVVIDGERYEVKESWFIGINGNQVKVNGFASDGTYYYAATDIGLKRALMSAPNLADHNNWQTIGAANNLSAGACRNIFTVQNQLVLHKNDSLFVLNGTNWNFLYADNWPILRSSTSEGKIQLCERLNDAGRVMIINPDGSLFRQLSNAAISLPRNAILVNNDPWVADQFGGLSHHTASGYVQYKPNSPEATASGEMIVYNNVFYATAGEVNEAWNYQYNGNGIYQFKEGQWNNINRYRYTQIDTLLDYITIAVDPRDESVWAGSYGGGLLHLRPGPAFIIYKQQVIGAAIGDPTSYRVSGLAFDRDNNLWVANYASAQPLKVRRNDGNWQSISIPFLLNENAVSQIVIDDNNYKWIVSPKGNGLICYDHGAAIDNTGDDRWRMYRGGPGSGNLPTSDVQCIAKDKNGFVWVGTSDGIGVIQCTQEAFTAQGCEAIWPIVAEGNFAGYLFKGEEVRWIAIDGADRKWVATKNGAWLISADGTKVIYRFTEDNSPLLSSDIKKIAIDGKTGEVYFATLKGICSFRSTATEGGETNSDVLIFPNPVPPNHTGPVAIRGLVNNAVVKITEMNGRLVYQTRAFGGQAIWDGKDYRGRKIASGVYLVLISNDGKTEKEAGRIVFISK